MATIYKTPEGDQEIASGADDAIVDMEAAMTCWREIPELLARLVTPPETLKVVREKVFGALNNLDDLVTFRGEISAAGAAHRVRVRYEPSPMLVQLVTALRTGDLEFLIEHEFRPEGQRDRSGSGEFIHHARPAAV